MKLSVHTMAVDTFVAMLQSLGEWLRKGDGRDLVDARLAPDMYTLAQQVQQACYHATEGVARLTGRPGPEMADAETSVAGIQKQLARTIEHLRSVPSDAFAGAEDRDCSIDTPNGMVIAMDGAQFLRAWALPHFYFHVVTAYGILRHVGVQLGKQDYLSQVGPLLRPR